MHRKKETAKPRILRRVLVIVTIVAVLAGALSFVVFAQNSFVITDGENVTFYRSFSSNPDAILDEAGIALGAEDTYTTTYTGGVNRITISRLQTVTITYRGMKAVATSHGEPSASCLSVWASSSPTATLSPATATRLPATVCRLRSSTAARRC